jgi:hypothetical protein
MVFFCAREIQNQFLLNHIYLCGKTKGGEAKKARKTLKIKGFLRKNK